MIMGGNKRSYASNILTLLTLMLTSSIVQANMMTDAMAANNHEEIHVPPTPPATVDGEILLECFGGTTNNNNPLHTWTQKNDPVMGGQSTGSFEVRDNTGIMDGHVAIVPFLKAPGFIKVETSAGEVWPDISSCTGLRLNVRAPTTEYSGYRVSFGRQKKSGFHFSKGYKTDLHLSSESSTDMEDIVLNFNDFSLDWNEATGDQTTTCEDNPDNCPSMEALQDIYSISLWAEGVEGDAHLVVGSIHAVGCDTTSSNSAEEDADHSGGNPTQQVTHDGDEIMIEDFANPKLDWSTLSDPVMGGLSDAEVSVHDGIASFIGHVKIVPSLQAPGFITMVNRGGVYPDVSSCNALKLVLTAQDAYDGYYVSFGSARAEGARYSQGFKAPFVAPVVQGDGFSSVVLPFSSFSDNWDGKTGHTIVSCEDDSQYCPDMNTLKDFQTMSIWGEGVAGTINLTIQSISVVGCAAGEGQLPTTDTPDDSTTLNEEPPRVANSGDEIIIEDFSNPMHDWSTLNDPVMGGLSDAKAFVQDGVASFTGHVKIVPSLQAPGFITMVNFKSVYPDVSSCNALKLVLKAQDAYSGYYVSFGSAHVEGDHHAFGFKAPFDAPVQDGFINVVLPFSSFSDNWDDATGHIKVSCEDDPQYCPDTNTLKDFQTMSIWGEGVVGTINLTIQSISAVGCAGDGQLPTTVGPGENSNHDNTIASKEEPPRVANGGDEVIIEDFSDPMFHWDALNDPVMGGQSDGSVSVEDGIAYFTGHVKIVPFLQAPGFITMVNRGGAYPDVSSCNALKLVLKAQDAYSGYYVSFGSAHAEGGRYAQGFKAPFDAPVQDGFINVVLPFSSFSDNWDDATGHIKVSCEDDSQYCPDMNTLKDFQTMSIWGEGVAGTIDLMILTISAVGCAGDGKLSQYGPVVTATRTESTTSSSHYTIPFVTATIGLAALGAILATAIFFGIRRHRISVTKEQYGKIEDDLRLDVEEPPILYEIS